MRPPHDVRLRIAVLVVLGSAAVPARSASPERLERRCHAAVGQAGVTCLRDYTAEVRRCRDAADAACEDALRMPDGPLEEIVADLEGPIRKVCTDASAERISSSLGVDRHIHYVAEGCEKWAEQFLDVVYVDDPAALSQVGLACQHHVALRLARLRDKVSAVSGACNAAEFAGHDCKRSRRDQKIDAALVACRRGILKRCGATFDQLGLVAAEDGATLEARVDVLLDRVAVPARNFALRVYPQLNMGPTALPGAAPVGVRTLELVDETRQNPAGTGPRTLTVEVYHPS